MSVIDLPRARRALAELDRIAEAHPERLGRGPRWSDHTDQLEKAMGTPSKERVQQYRQRLRAEGYAPMSIYLTQEARDRLKRLAKARGESYGDVIGAALKAMEGDGNE